jgi:hypothetical protein
MNAFRFPLEKVLEWRRTQSEIEELKVKQHAAILSELDRSRAELAAAAIQAELQVREATSVAGAELAALAGFRAHTRKREREILQHRALQVQKLAQQKHVMLEARRRYRLLERLRERRHAEWQSAADREMESFAAEAYLAQWTKRRS